MNKRKKFILVIVVIIVIGLGGFACNKHTNKIVKSSMEEYVAEKYEDMNIFLENVHYSISFGNYIGLAYVNKAENEYFTLVSDKKGNIVKDYYTDFFNEDGSYIFEGVNNKKSQEDIIKGLIEGSIKDLSDEKIKVDDYFIEQLGQMIISGDGQMTNNKISIKEKELVDGYKSQYLEKSYMYQFFDKYWVDIYPDFIEENKKEEGMFYEYYKEEFLSEDAARSPEDDLIASFVKFIYDDKPTEINVINKKIMFFYDYDELIELKEILKKY